jgi:hypothetical protein
MPVTNHQHTTVETAVDRQSESFAAAMLIVACLCWASFFSLCKNWQEAAHACPGGEFLASLTLLVVVAGAKEEDGAFLALFHRSLGCSFCWYPSHWTTGCRGYFG